MEVFDNWFDALRDRQAKQRISVRIRRLVLVIPDNIAYWLAA